MSNVEPLSGDRTSMRIPYPEGLLRLAFRAPILLYRMRLGWLLGNRFLLLHHQGRRSGLPRQAVVEVVDSDLSQGTFVVVSAWGLKANWYRNVLANPAVEIEVSTKRFQAVAKTVTPQEAEAHFREYSRRHPKAFRELGSLLLGGQSRDVDQMIRRVVDRMPVVQFGPTRPAP